MKVTHAGADIGGYVERMLARAPDLMSLAIFGSFPCSTSGSM
jgi:hypothetical protein